MPYIQVNGVSQMARPRTFNEDEIIEKAMFAFWKQGYEATSIGDLETATGISRISIYNAFGDKEGLFLKALSKYHQIAYDFFNEEFVNGGLRSISELFEGIASDKPNDAPQRFGCMLVNTVLDVETVGSKAEAIVQRCRCDMLTAFAAAIEQAAKQGHIKNTPEKTDDRSEFLVGAMWGCWTTARSQRNAAAAKGIARTVLDTLRTW
ncbi:MAG: TetR/AcrR family transcriptional regulator [Pseudomonadota bacterium]